MYASGSFGAIPIAHVLLDPLLERPDCEGRVILREGHVRAGHVAIDLFGALPAARLAEFARARRPSGRPRPGLYWPAHSRRSSAGRQEREETR